MKQKLFITAAAAALLLSSSLFATTAAARQITIPLRLISKGSARLGISVGDECATPLEWNGFLEVLGEPQIDAQKKLLSFKIIESHIYDE
jgi:hypothetical protein